MPVQLPFVPGVPAYRFGTVLEGVQFLFDVHWNTRDEAWYFDLLDADENMLRAGIKIVLGAALGVRDAAKPLPGIMLAVDTAGTGVDAGIDDLGTRIIVVYYEAA